MSRWSRTEGPVSVDAATRAASIADLLNEMTLQAEHPVPDSEIAGERRADDVLSVLEDQTDEARRLSRLAVLESGIDLLDEGMAITDGRLDRDGPRILFANHAFAALLGAPGREIEGACARELLGSTRWERLRPLMMAARESHGPAVGQSVITARDRGEVLVDWQMMPIRDAKAGSTYFVATVREVHELDGPESGETRSRDRSTGLPDRTLFMSRLGRSVAWAQRMPHYRFAVLCMEMDGLDAVRRAKGKTLAAQIVKAAGWRVQNALRPLDLVARMDSNRLLVLLEQPGEPHEIDRVLARVQAQLGVPFRIGGEKLSVSVFIGVAFGTAGYRLSEDVIGDAVAALESAREHGRRGGYAVHDVLGYRKSRGRAEQIQELRTGLIRRPGERLAFRFQPILDLDARRPAGLEALLRWRSRGGHLLTPAEFLPQLREAGLGAALDGRVVEGVLSEVAKWRREVPGSLPPISVNLPQGALVDPRLQNSIRRALAQGPPIGEGLAFEVSFDRPDRGVTLNRRGLRDLASLGASLWIDGFGVDDFPLAELGDLPIRMIKVHPSIVARLGGDEEEGAVRVLRAARAVADILGAEPVAVGLESDAQIDRVRALGFRLGQGYKLAPLLAPPEVTAYLRELTPP